MTIKEFTKIINEWGSQQIPFLFLVDFEMEKSQLFRLTDIDPSEILYDFNGVTNASHPPQAGEAIHWSAEPVTLAEYEQRFNQVRAALEYGDSYLTNLTVKTVLRGDIVLKNIFYQSRAKYKLWFRDQFLVFSPEIFVQVRGRKIF